MEENGVEKGEVEKKDEEKTTKNYNRLIWFWFSVITVAISLAVGGATNYLLKAYIYNYVFGAVAGVTGALVLWVPTIILAWRQVPHMEEWIIEALGEYTGKPRKAGLTFVFPYFYLVRVRSQVYLGEQIMELYLDEKVTGKYSGGGDIEFKDGSASIIAKVFFILRDAKKATYNIADVFRGIEEKMDGALRSYLGQYTIDEATRLKVHFKKGVILNGIRCNEKGPESDALGEKTPAEQYMLNEWGAEITNIIITDIVLPEEIQKQRIKVLEAAKDAEAAKSLAEKRKTLAEGEKVALGKEGEGFRKKIEEIVASGVAPTEAVTLLQKLELYKNIGQNAVIIESGDTTAGAGAKFGAGFGKSSAVAKEDKS